MPCSAGESPAPDWAATISAASSSGANSISGR